MFGFFKKNKSPNTTSNSLSSKIKALFGKKELNAAMIDQLEELLYEADLGSELIDSLIKAVTTENALSYEECLHVIQKELLKAIPELPKTNTSSQVILIVGINGSGKTTSIAKLANFYKEKGESVLIAAADTFRAAAVKQLSMWAERLSIPIVKGTEGGDPAACVYDAMQAAKSRKVDRLIIDTAGRLHTKTDLMGELKKIHQVCKKIDSTAPHEVWMVVDASIGQNATEQIRLFAQYVPLTGIILSKWDGSAKGGASISILKKLKLPIRFIGVGESEKDIMEFEAKAFVEAILQ